MLVKNRGAAWALAALGGLAIIGFLFFDSHHCFYDHSACGNYQNYSAVDNSKGSFIVSLPDWASSNKDAIDALAAIASVVFSLSLAVFTGVLASRTSGLHAETAALRATAEQQRMDMLRSVIATEKAADAAKRTVDVLIATERSELVLAEIGLATLPDPLPGQPNNFVPAGLLGLQQFRIVTAFKSSGRSACKIKDICIEWSIINRESSDRNPSPPSVPIYVHHIPAQIFVDGNQIFASRWSEEKNGIISLFDPTQREAINTNKAWLWVWGRVIYADFVGDEYEVGFVAHWEAIKGSTLGATAVTVARGFVIEGPEQYIYRRRRN
jgi:hypothetical protein